MITLELENKKYTIPNNFNELPLHKYQEVCKLDKTDKYYILDVVGILGDIDMNILKQVAFSDLKGVFENVEYLFKQDEHKLQGVIEVDGDYYGFHNNLSKLTFGEYIDIEEMTKDVSNNLHIIMAIFYRPIKNITNDIIYNEGEFEIEPYNEHSVMDRAEKFKKLKMDVILGALFFFILLRVGSLMNIKDFLQKEMKMEKNMKKVKEKE